MNFRKAEPWFFWCLVLLHLVPVLSLDYFVTHDGPAHVYNADLIKSLLFSGESPGAKDFFEFNSFPQPNWSGHILLILFGFVFSPSFSEILLVSGIIVLTAFSFRYLLMYLIPAKMYTAWFVFPFLHGFLLYMGFYNFCLGTALVFLGAGWFLRNRTRFSLRNMMVLFLLATALYFSHLFCLLLFLIWMGFVVVLDMLLKKQALQLHARWILPLIPVLALSLIFIFTGESGNSSSRETTELLKWILDARPVITLNYEKQQLFSIVAGISILAVLLFLGVHRIIKERALRISDSLAFTAIFCFICYFVFPDEAATGGFVSIRFLLFFFLFALSWIACRLKKEWMGMALAAILLMVSVRMLWFHYHEMNRLSEDVSIYTKAGEHLQSGEVVLPLNYSDNWLHSNISCYLGAERHAVLLDNYEASKPHFPLQWKRGKDPYETVGRFSASIPPCFSTQALLKTELSIDAVVCWRSNEPADSCSREIRQWLEQEYKAVGKESKGNYTVWK